MIEIVGFAASGLSRTAPVQQPDADRESDPAAPASGRSSAPDRSDDGTSASPLLSRPGPARRDGSRGPRHLDRARISARPSASAGRVGSRRSRGRRGLRRLDRSRRRLGGRGAERVGPLARARRQDARGRRGGLRRAPVGRLGLRRWRGSRSPGRSRRDAEAARRSAGGRSVAVAGTGWGAAAVWSCARRACHGGRRARRADAWAGRSRARAVGGRGGACCRAGSRAGRAIRRAVAARADRSRRRASRRSAGAAGRPERAALTPARAARPASVAPPASSPRRPTSAAPPPTAAARCPAGPIGPSAARWRRCAPAAENRAATQLAARWQRARCRWRRSRRGRWGGSLGLRDRAPRAGRGRSTAASRDARRHSHSVATPAIATITDAEQLPDASSWRRSAARRCWCRRSAPRRSRRSPPTRPAAPAARPQLRPTRGRSDRRSRSGPGRSSAARSRTGSRRARTTTTLTKINASSSSAIAPISARSISCQPPSATPSDGVGHQLPDPIGHRRQGTGSGG